MSAAHKMRAVPAPDVDINDLALIMARAQGLAKALGNWTSMVAISGSNQNVPANQVAPAANTGVVGMQLTPTVTGMVLCLFKISYSGNTTAQTIVPQLWTGSGAGAGLGGANTVAQGFNGGQVVAGTGGFVLNANAAGGNGLTFNGAALNTFTQQQLETQPTLTGLLTAQGVGANQFVYVGLLNSVGAASAVKTIFPLGVRMFAGLTIANAGTVNFADLSFTLVEWPFL